MPIRVNAINTPGSVADDSYVATCLRERWPNLVTLSRCTQRFSANFAGQRLPFSLP
jgi:hypothetical protein